MLSEVRRQIVPDTRTSSCTVGSVAEVGARPTDEKRTSVSRAQSSWASVGDEASVVSQVAGVSPDDVWGPSKLNSALIHKQDWTKSADGAFVKEKQAWQSRPKSDFG